MLSVAKNAASLRASLENSLCRVMPHALSPAERSAPERFAFGIPALDEQYGGIATGTITELIGPESSGRTTAAISFLAGITNRDAVCAWIDVHDSLDPESAAACGVDLERLLWVRCGTDQVQPDQPLAGTVQKTASMQTADAASQNRHTGGGSLHPRAEGRGMPQAVGALLQAHGGFYDKQVRREKRAIGTPGAPNRPVARASADREEQVNSDRLPPRRGSNITIVPRCAELQTRCIANLPLKEHLSLALSKKNGDYACKPWPLLDQALRVTDLLLQGGGFTSIVLDLGSTPTEAAWRIPQATWFRFRAACERTRVSLILLTQHACAGTCAELAVRLPAGCIEAENRVMTGISYQVGTERSHIQQSHMHVVSSRKLPQSEPFDQWKGRAAWATAK